MCAPKKNFEDSLEPPHRGGSKEPQKKLFWSINKKTKIYPCKPCFSLHEAEFTGALMHEGVNVMSCYI